MSQIIDQTMQAAFLPGNSTVELRKLPVPRPGHGEVLLRMKASTICGSDIRCIYHEHLGKGPEGYQGVIAGHEPCGQIVEAGPGCRRFKAGDRVIVYHISGCGVCNDCRRGYMISCTSEKYRRAYGWQRDGGMADYMIAEEKDLIALPDRALLCRWRAGGLRLRDGLRGPGEDRNQRQPRRADYGPGAGGPGRGRAVPQAGRAHDHRHRCGAGAHADSRRISACATTCCASGPTTWRRCAS